MVAWLITIGFWAVGLIVMAGGWYIGHKLDEKNAQLKKETKSAEGQDAEATMYYAMEEKMIDALPWVTVRLSGIIIGMIIFAFGFVALSFVF